MYFKCLRLHDLYILLNIPIILGYLVSHNSVQNGSKIFLSWFIDIYLNTENKSMTHLIYMDLL